MAKQATLPGRCIKCNAFTEGRLQRKLSWHHPALYLLIFVSILIYVIVAAVVRKTATVDVGLCTEHLGLRKRNIAITWGLFVAAVGTFFAFVEFWEPLLLLTSTLLLFGTAVFGILSLRTVVPTKIDDHYVWIKGADANYLQQFPELSGAR